MKNGEKPLVWYIGTLFSSKDSFITGYKLEEKQVILKSLRYVNEISTYYTTSHRNGNFISQNTYVGSICMGIKTNSIAFQFGWKVKSH